mmetsp:Transcript_7207/g.12785  ORF Transcript_7207/g.12785 Transcript_7207/m.12785 type:complete len:150 (+) Transcript_7207:154-603(+)
MATVNSIAAAAKTAARGEKVLRLLLAESVDLQCRNIMCEKLEEACVCRLARFVTQTRLVDLIELDITSNRLDVLPTTVFEELPALEKLVLAKNNLRTVPEEVSKLSNLQILDIRENPIESLPTEAIASLPKLEQLFVQGLSPEIVVSCI